MCKLLFLTSLLITLCSYSYALERTIVSCGTSDFLTTSQSLTQKPDQSFLLNVTHHNGLQYAPISDGFITSADLKQLQAKVLIVQKLGAQYSISFSRDSCSYKKNTWTCFVKKYISTGDLYIKNVNFIFYPEKRISQKRIFHSYKSRLSFYTKDNTTYTLPMEYLSTDCIVDSTINSV